MFFWRAISFIFLSFLFALQCKQRNQSEIKQGQGNFLDLAQMSSDETKSLISRSGFASDGGPTKVVSLKGDLVANDNYNLEAPYSEPLRLEDLVRIIIQAGWVKLEGGKNQEAVLFAPEVNQELLRTYEEKDKKSYTVDLPLEAMFPKEVYVKFSGFKDLKQALARCEQFNTATERKNLSSPPYSAWSLVSAESYIGVILNYNLLYSRKFPAGTSFEAMGLTFINDDVTNPFQIVPLLEVEDRKRAKSGQIFVSSTFDTEGDWEDLDVIKNYFTKPADERVSEFFSKDDSDRVDSLVWNIYQNMLAEGFEIYCSLR